MQPGAEPSAAAWAQVRALFERLADLPLAEQAAALAAADASPAVRDEAASLLSHSQADPTREGGGPGFLASPLPQADADADADDGCAPPPGREGQRLGPWLIEGLLGRGGMGEVWTARRVDAAYEGRAAIKVLRRGMDSGRVLARFALEQRLLARLNHPHIAHLLDAGRTDDGLPYFVMEWVDGQTIDRACTGRSIDQRLALFLQLSDAVAHAHRQLLVHRDLKPGNVLVNTEGQVKLLDFGIAKAIDPLEGADGHTTAVGERPFTPHYASPEQVRGELVGTGTDIYSLGVLLYQMLTGLRPYGRDAKSAREAARSVLEETPSRPSALSPGLVADPNWAATRRQLEGDLDNILLKALSKQVDTRYPSVDALAADIRAHQAGYPVSARAPSAGYLLSRFVARNKPAVVAGVLALCALLGGLGASLWQAHQAALARDATQRQLVSVKRIANDLVFRYGDAISLLPGGAPAQEAVLQQVVTSLDQALAAAPDDADLVVLVVSALGRLAQLQGNPSFAAPERAAQARATVARALALADQVWTARLGGVPYEWRFASQHLITLLTQAQLLRGAGDPAGGLAVLRQAAQRTAQALAAPGLADEGRANLLELSANIWTNTAHFHDHTNRPSLGQPQAALAFYDRAEADFRALYGNPALAAAMDQAATPGDPTSAEWRRHNIANVNAGRALAWQHLEDFGAMRREAEAALLLRQQNLAVSPKNVSWRQGLMFDSNTLAIALLRLNDPVPALAASQRAWDIAGALLQEAGPDSAWATTRGHFAPQYGRALAANGRPAQALPVYQLGLARLAAQRAQADTAVLQGREAGLQVSQAAALWALGQRAAARDVLGPAMAALPGLTEGDSVAAREARWSLAEGQALQAKLADAGLPAGQ